MMYSIKILTIGGHTLWQEDDHHNVEVDILQPNGIYLEIPPTQLNHHLYFCKVDPHKTNLSDFYKWEEISADDTTTFCWRSLYIFGETAEWLPIPDTEQINGLPILQLFDMIQESI